MNYDLSIVLPCYLEEENLRLLLPRINTVLNRMGIKYEVLVVDTSRPMDATKDACDQNGVRYINREGGDTYGDAIRTGIKQANGERVIFMDADGSHNPEFIEKLYKEKDEYDLVIASRYIEGGHTENTPVLILMSKIVNLGYALVLNIKCKDVSNSFKLYRTSYLKELVLNCNNFDVVEEILFKIIKKNKDIKIKELPFTFKKRMFGDTKRNLLSFIFTYIFTLFKLRFMR